MYQLPELPDLRAIRGYDLSKWAKTGRYTPVGYSCQSLLALYLNDRYYNEVHYAWFSTALNPVENGWLSNPLLRHLMFGQAMNLQARCQNVTGPYWLLPVLEQHKQGLRLGVRKKITDEDLRDELLSDIAWADVTWLTPQLLEINLDRIDLDQCRQAAEQDWRKRESPKPPL